jgi:GTP-binding protein Era
MREVYDALEGRDLLLLIVDVTQKLGSGDRFTLDLVRRTGGSVFLLLNKIDMVEKTRLLPIIDQYRREYDFREIIPISALHGDGLERLLDKIIDAMPEGPRYFPKDQITDQPERFLAAEIIREKVLLLTAQEVPYAATVVVEQWEESPRLTRIAATLYCEREGQKRILVGKGGEMLKKIGTEARQEIERILDTKVFLELFVKVHPGWRDSERFIEELDWRRA